MLLSNSGVRAVTFILHELAQISCYCNIIFEVLTTIDLYTISSNYIDYWWIRLNPNKEWKFWLLRHFAGFPSAAGWLTYVSFNSSPLEIQVRKDNWNGVFLYLALCSLPSPFHCLIRDIRRLLMSNIVLSFPIPRLFRVIRCPEPLACVSCFHLPLHNQSITSNIHITNTLISVEFGNSSCIFQINVTSNLMM